MRVLRTSMYPDPFRPPLTTVMRDSDTKDTLESCRVQLQEGSPEHLLIFEIFEMPDGSIERATMKAMERVRKIREKHMAMLYYWLAAMFRNCNPGATIGMPKPAPLSAADMRYVLELLTTHPRYRDFSIVGVAEDGTPVQVVKGKVE